jgi:hypothetical protein
MSILPPASDPAQTTVPLQLPQGSVAVRMRVFGTAEQELTAAATPPWPQWMRRLYEVYALQSSRVDASRGEVGVATALAALKERIAHRLGAVSFVCAHLEELGWEVAVSGPDVIAYRVTAPDEARQTMDAHQLTGAVIAVGDVDEQGRVRLYEPWELSAAGGAEWGRGDG